MGEFFIFAATLDNVCVVRIFPLEYLKLRNTGKFDNPRGFTTGDFLCLKKRGRLFSQPLF